MKAKSRILKTVPLFLALPLILGGISISKPVKSAGAMDFPDIKDTYIDIGEPFIHPINPSINPINLEGTTEEPVEEIVEEEVIPSSFCARDYYVSYGQNQTHTGLCWNYAATRSLETTWMTATNEYNDFSEPWISIAYAKQGSYVPNAGGTFSNFDNAFRNRGIVLEQDFHASEAYFTPKDTLDKHLEFYGRDVNKIMYQNLKKVSYSLKTKKDEVKKHLMTVGGMHIAATWSQTIMGTLVNGKPAYVKKPKESVSGAHAVCLVGWDDNVQYDDNGTIYTGAWIVQNSFGERELDQHATTYLMYDDTNIWSSAEAYVFNDVTATATGIDYVAYLKESNANVINHHAGHYCGEFKDRDEVTRQKNVFYDDKVELKYEYNISQDTTIEDISIFAADIDVTPYFEVKLDQEKQTLEIASDKTISLEEGGYKIKLELHRGDAVEYGYNTFYVMNGAEINSMFMENFNGYGTSTLGNYLYKGEEQPIDYVDNNGYYSHFNTYNFSQNLRTIDVASCQESGTIQFLFYVNSYDDIDHVCYGDSVVLDTVVFGKNYFNINYSGLTEENPVISSSFNFVTTSGKVNSIPFILRRATPDQKYVYLRLGSNGGRHPNGERVLVSPEANIEIEPATREGYKFEGWYYDPEFTQPLEKSNDKFIYDREKTINLNTIGSSTLYSYYYSLIVYYHSDIATAYAKWSFDPVKKADIIANSNILIGNNYKYAIDFEGLDTIATDYEFILKDNGTEIMSFKDKSFSYTLNDLDEHKLSLEVVLTYKGKEYHYQGNECAVKASEPLSPGLENHTIVFNAPNCNVSGTLDEYESMSTASFTVTPNEGYKLPKQITILGSHGDVAGNYNPSTGVITIIVSDDVFVSIEASKIPEVIPTYHVICDFEGVSGEVNPTYKEGDLVELTLATEKGFKSIDEVKVEGLHGEVEFTFDKATNKLSFEMTDDVVIKAHASSKLPNSKILLATSIALGSVALIALAGAALSIILTNKKRKTAN